MPLRFLDISLCPKIRKLSSLQGLDKLTSLKLTQSNAITDLTPLKLMKLESIHLSLNNIVKGGRRTAGDEEPAEDLYAFGILRHEGILGAVRRGEDQEVTPAG